jgi:hypothetical protein
MATPVAAQAVDDLFRSAPAVRLEGIESLEV